jgi:AGZA family xanthine/uracil permease-like MFS transporter
MGFLERVFRLRESGTNVRTELLGGLVTFMTMAYIIFVNPQILAVTGMDRTNVITATCLGSAFATILMGLVARYPIALAPGMGLNALFSFWICGQMHVPWTIALGIVFMAGVLFVLLTLIRIRETIIYAIPAPLKFSIAAGIGVFIAFIGLKNAGIVTSSGATLVQLGDLRQNYALVALAGLVVTGALMAARIRGAILIGLIATGVIGIFAGIVQLPTRVVAVPEFDKVFLKMDLAGVFTRLDVYLAPIILLLFFAMFDTVGTLIGVGEQAGFLDKNDKLPRAGRALLCDAVGSMAGAAMGTSTVTCYIESSAGVAEGARTGLANMVTGILFIVAVFFTPVVATFSSSVRGGFFPITSPALIVVGVLMMGNVARIKWTDFSEAIPAFLTIVLMPLTYSIAIGLAMGFTSYPLIKLLSGRGKEAHWFTYVLGAIFAGGLVLWAVYNPEFR